MREQALRPLLPVAEASASGSRKAGPPIWSDLLRTLVLVAVLVVTSGSIHPPPAGAAEIRLVRTPELLLVGDGNRSYTVALPCIEVDPDRREAAVDWLRREVPRGTRVNLLPLGRRDGVLMAQVRRLDRSTDLTSGLIDAGLASSVACPEDPQAALRQP